MKITVLDFETADYSADSACALGIVIIEDGTIVHRESFLIRPPRNRVMFTDIHGLTWNDVCEAPSFKEHIPIIQAHLRGADFIAAHNAGFDRKVLFTCFAAAGYAPPEVDALCTVKLSKAAWGIRPTKLPDVCQHFQIELDHHDALSDANACAEILVIAISEGFDLERGKLGKPSYQIAV